MTMLLEWPGEAIPDYVDSNFIGIEVTKMPGNFPPIKEIVKDHLTKRVEKLRGTEFEKDWPLILSNCVYSITRYRRYNLNICDDINDVNEATVRLVLGNEIAMMICSMNNYRFRVEDKVCNYDEGMETDDLTGGISTKSTADYVCFSILEKMRAVAVVIETKKHFSLNAVAQLLGYYYRLPTDIRKPGVGILLTQTTMNIVLFPFHTDGGLANAVCFSGLIINNTQQLELALNIVALITSAEHYRNPLNVPLVKQFIPIRKSFELLIVTEQERNLALYNKKVEELEDQILKLKREVAEMKCKFFPVAVTSEKLKVSLSHPQGNY